MIPSHQIYIPSQIIHNMFLKKTKWPFIDEESETDDVVFAERCGQISQSTIFQSDRYIDLKDYNELASEIGNNATGGGVFTAAFTNGNFIGFELFGEYAGAVGAGATGLGTAVTLIGGLSLLIQTKTAADINDFKEKLYNSLCNGNGNIIYNSVNTELEDSHFYNFQEWSAWNEKRYINKYTEIYYGVDTNSIFLYEPGLFGQNVHKELKYYLYMENDPENHFWDLYASGNYIKK